MKVVASTVCAVVLLLAVFSMGGQQRPAPAASDDRGARGGGGAGSSSVGSRGVSVGQTSAATPSVVGRGVYSSSPSRVGNGTSLQPGGTLNLARTSFVNPNVWLRSEEYFWYLQNYYGVNPYYFRRFYRNSEPLMTPQIAKLTLRQPIAWSTSMVASLDSLETMIRDRQEGKDVSQQAIAAKADEIRDLAKQIRSDQSIAFFDQRKDKDLLKGLNLSTPEALAQLREMVTSLNTQLKGLYEEAKPFSVSVNSLAQPSFQSLSKGIEKLTKSIESSAGKI
jgi:hypothetical protein